MTALLVPACTSANHSRVGSATTSQVFSPTPTRAPATTTSGALSTTPATAAEDGFPKAFVGVVNGGIDLFDSATGNQLTAATQRQPGGGDDEPVLRADSTTVYFVRGNGTCSSQIWRQWTTGARLESLDQPRDGTDRYLAVSADGRMLAWVHEPCQGPAVLVVRDQATGATRTLAMGNPLAVFGKPAWSPDDRHLAYFYRGGGGVAYTVWVVDALAATTLDAGKPLGGPYCYKEYPAYLPDGSLVVLDCQSAATEGPVAVSRYNPATGNRLGVLFTIATPPGGPAPDFVASFCLSPSGSAAIYSVMNAERTAVSVYRWSGGQPQLLHTPATEPAW